MKCFPSNCSRAEGLTLLFLFLLLWCASCSNPAKSSRGASSTHATVLHSNVVTRTVQVSPRLPVYRFVLIRDPAASETPEGRQPVGRIDIYAGDSPKLRQSVEVDGPDPNWFQSSFHTVDINFDGYQDFAVVNEVGGKWSSDHYWLFDPGSGRYITNALTVELSNLAQRELELIPSEKAIRITFFVGTCPKSFAIYQVKEDHLVLMESEIHAPKELGHCVVERRKRVNGEVATVGKWEENHVP